MNKKNNDFTRASESINRIPDKVSVLGAARSGMAVIKYLLKRGITPFLSDICADEKLEAILKSQGLINIDYEANGHTRKILDSELIICSPGIPSDIPVLKEARKRDIPIWSEVEFAYRQSTAPFLAVTGSTGKSTTVSLLGSIFEEAGKEHVVAGNIGLPLIKVAPDISKNGFVISEISSFQLENIDVFKPKVAAILNLMKNHLDRYKNEEEYYNAKKSIISAMDRSDILVLNANDNALSLWARQINNDIPVVFFGRDIQNSDCVWYEGLKMMSKFNNKRENVLDLDKINIRGRHNYDNACAAYAIAISSGIDKKSIKKGIINFRGLSHRLEFVKEVDSIKYYNDSKATTAESVECAVNAFESNVHLIAGGRDKGCNFSLIRDSVQKKVKSVCLLGEAADRIYDEWQGIENITRVETLKMALDVIRKNAKEGDVILLSPGCSSFDMFSSYEERGDVFKYLVHNL
jgi:UDP-N-acetylmuramoylalanine--D-glutamate ligase